MRLPGSRLPEGVRKQGRDGSLRTVLHRHPQGVHRSNGSHRIQSEEGGDRKAVLHPMEIELALRRPIDPREIRQAKGFLHGQRSAQLVLGLESHPEGLHQRSDNLQPSAIDEGAGGLRGKAG